jgi:hypothetical protein
LKPKSNSRDHPKGPKGARPPEPRSHNAAAAERQGPPDRTWRETEYLKGLVANKTRVRVKLKDNERVEGVVEYYDAGFIRLTRAGGPNLFIYKSDIKYLEEMA